MTTTLDNFYSLKIGNTIYVDPQDGCSAWHYNAAKAIARNVAVANKTTVQLVSAASVTHPVVERKSLLDSIIESVDALKGKALTDTLRLCNLPVGGDAVASKRQRLIQHLTK